MQKVLICGNYGSTNLGDEAVLSGILHELRATGKALHITVMSYDPVFTSQVHHVSSVYLLPCGLKSFLRGVFRGELFRSVCAMRSSYFLFGGGTLFRKDSFYANFLWGMHVLVAVLICKKVSIYAQGFDKFRGIFIRFFLKFILKYVDSISVRDFESLDVLHNLGIEGFSDRSQKIILVQPDPVFFLQPVWGHSENMLSPVNNNFSLPKTPYIIVNVRNFPLTEDALQSFALFLDSLIVRYGYRILLLPFQRIKDADDLLLNKILGHIKNKNSVQFFDFRLGKDFDFHRLFSLFSDAYCVISMRLHGLIFASICNVPFVSICSSEKMERFVRSFGLQKYGIFDLSSLNLMPVFERFTKDYAFVKNTLKENTVMYCRDEFKSQDFLKDFLSGI